MGCRKWNRPRAGPEPVYWWEKRKKSLVWTAVGKPPCARPCVLEAWRKRLWWATARPMRASTVPSFSSLFLFLVVGPVYVFSFLSLFLFLSLFGPNDHIFLKILFFTKSNRNQIKFKNNLDYKLKLSEQKYLITQLWCPNKYPTTKLSSFLNKIKENKLIMAHNSLL